MATTKKAAAEEKNLGVVDNPSVPPPAVPAEAPMDPRDAKIASLEAKLDAVSDFIASQATQTAPKRVIEKTARVMFIADKAVVKFGSAFTRKGPDNKDILMISATLRSKEGAEEEVELEYLLMLNDNPRFLCDILGQTANKQTTHQGPIRQTFRTKVADPMGLRASGAAFTPQDIVLEHTQVFYRSKVKFLEGPWSGEEMEIANEALNP